MNDAQFEKKMRENMQKVESEQRQRHERFEKQSGAAVEFNESSREHGGHIREIGNQSDPKEVRFSGGRVGRSSRNKLGTSENEQRAHSGKSLRV